MKKFVLISFIFMLFAVFTNTANAQKPGDHTKCCFWFEQMDAQLASPLTNDIYGIDRQDVQFHLNQKNENVEYYYLKFINCTGNPKTKISMDWEMFHNGAPIQNPLTATLTALGINKLNVQIEMFLPEVIGNIMTSSGPLRSGMGLQSNAGNFAKTDYPGAKYGYQATLGAEVGYLSISNDYTYNFLYADFLEYACANNLIRLRVQRVQDGDYKLHFKFYERISGSDIEKYYIANQQHDYIGGKQAILGQQLGDFWLEEQIYTTGTRELCSDETVFYGADENGVPYSRTHTVVLPDPPLVEVADFPFYNPLWKCRDYIDSVATLTMTWYPEPPAPIADSIAICGPGEVTLNANTPLNDVYPYIHKWYSDPGCTMLLYTGDAYTANYAVEDALTEVYLTASLANCVSDVTRYVVWVNKQPVAFIPNRTICPYNVAFLHCDQVIITNGYGDYTYVWDNVVSETGATGCTQVTDECTQFIVFGVEITDTYSGCTATAYSEVTVRDPENEFTLAIDDITVYRNAICEYDATTAVTGLPAVTSTCGYLPGSYIITFEDDLHARGCDSEITRTFTVENYCGQQHTIVQTITITDVLVPLHGKAYFEVTLSAIWGASATENCIPLIRPGTIAGLIAAFEVTDNCTPVDEIVAEIWSSTVPPVQLFDGDKVVLGAIYNAWFYDNCNNQVHVKFDFDAPDYRVTAVSDPIQACNTGDATFNLSSTPADFESTKPLTYAWRGFTTVTNGLPNLQVPTNLQNAVAKPKRSDNIDVANYLFSYEISVTDEFGCVAKDTVVVTLLALPQFTALDHSICDGETAGLVITSLNAPPTAYKYYINNVEVFLVGATSSTAPYNVKPTPFGKYYYEAKVVNNATGCFKVDMIEVEVKEVPVLTVNPVTVPNTNCKAEKNGAIAYTVSANATIYYKIQGGAFAAWAGTSPITGLAAGKYFVKARHNTTLCETTEREVTVADLSLAQRPTKVFTSSHEGHVCFKITEEVTFSIVPDVRCEEYTRYIMLDGVNTNTTNTNISLYNVNQVRLYNFDGYVVCNATGCPSDTTRITIDAYSTPHAVLLLNDLDADIEICYTLNETSITIKLSDTIAVPYNEYKYDITTPIGVVHEASSIFHILSAGVYEIKGVVTNLTNGCKDSATHFIAAYPSPVVVVDKPVFCYDTPNTLTANVIDDLDYNPIATHFTWTMKDEDGNDSIISTTSTLDLTLIALQEVDLVVEYQYNNTLYCAYDERIVIDPKPLPDFTAVPTPNRTCNDTIKGTITLTSNTAEIYTYYKGSIAPANIITGNIARNLVHGDYTIFAVDADGCVSSQVVTVAELKILLNPALWMGVSTETLAHADLAFCNSLPETINMEVRYAGDPRFAYTYTIVTPNGIRDIGSTNFIVDRYGDFLIQGWVQNLTTGCTSPIDTHFVYAVATPVFTIVKSAEIMCDYETIVASANITNNDVLIHPLTYSWNNYTYGLTAIYDTTYWRGIKLHLKHNHPILACSITMETTLPFNPSPAIPIVTGACIYAPGTTATLTATAHAGFTYIWKKNNVVIPLATTNTLVLPNLVAADAGAYTVAVTNNVTGCTSLYSVAANVAVSTMTLYLETPGTTNVNLCNNNVGTLLLSATADAQLTGDFVHYEMKVNAGTYTAMGNLATIVNLVKADIALGTTLIRGFYITTAGCRIDLAPVTINKYDSLAFDIVAHNTPPLLNVTLQTNYTGTAPTYLWSTTATTATITIPYAALFAGSGVYNVRITDGCTGSSVMTLPAIVRDTICYGATKEFHGTNFTTANYAVGNNLLVAYSADRKTIHRLQLEVMPVPVITALWNVGGGTAKTICAAGLAEIALTVTPATLPYGKWCVTEGATQTCDPVITGGKYNVGSKAANTTWNYFFTYEGGFSATKKCTAVQSNTLVLTVTPSDTIAFTTPAQSSVAICDAQEIVIPFSVIGTATGWMPSNYDPLSLLITTDWAAKTVTIKGLIAGVHSYRIYLTGGCDNVYVGGLVDVKRSATSITVNGDSPICINAVDEPYTISGTMNDATFVSWTTNDSLIATIVATTGELTPVAAGIVNVIYTATNATPCTAFVPVTKEITIVALSNAGTITGDAYICGLGDKTTYTSNGDAGGAWSSSDPAVATIDVNCEVTAVAEGNTFIIYTITNATCGDDATLKVVEVALPVNPIDTTQAYCHTGFDISIADILFTNVTSVTYLPPLPPTLASAKVGNVVTLSGDIAFDDDLTILATVTTLCGVVSDVTLHLYVIPALTLDGTKDMPRCDAGKVTFDADPSDTTATVKWYSDITANTLIGTGKTFEFTATTTTTIYAVGEVTYDGVTCYSAIIPFTITINASPAIAIAGASPICFSTTTLLTASGATDYEWSTGETTSTIDVSAGTYTVTGTDGNGCFGTATKIVVNFELVYKPVADRKACPGTPLNVVVTSDELATFTIQGYDAATNAEITALIDASTVAALTHTFTFTSPSGFKNIYFVVVATSNGCTFPAVNSEWTDVSGDAFFSVYETAGGPIDDNVIEVDMNTSLNHYFKILNPCPAPDDFRISVDYNYLYAADSVNFAETGSISNHLYGTGTSRMQYRTPVAICYPNQVNYSYLMEKGHYPNETTGSGFAYGSNRYNYFRLGFISGIEVNVALSGFTKPGVYKIDYKLVTHRVGSNFTGIENDGFTCGGTILGGNDFYTGTYDNFVLSTRSFYIYVRYVDSPVPPIPAPIAPDMSIYPNPTKDATINVAFENVEGNVTVHIMSLNGVVISTQELNVNSLAKRVDQINLPDLKPGIYFVNVITDKAILTRKLIINK